MKCQVCERSGQNTTKIKTSSDAKIEVCPECYNVIEPVAREYRKIARSLQIVILKAKKMHSQKEDEVYAEPHAEHEENEEIDPTITEEQFTWLQQFRRNGVYYNAKSKGWRDKDLGIVSEEQVSWLLEKGYAEQQEGQIIPSEKVQKTIGR